MHLLRLSVSCNIQDVMSKHLVFLFLAKHCYNGDCYLFGAYVSCGSLFSHCEDLGYRAVKISNRDEQEYLLKLVRESTADSSVPMSHLGR